MSLEESGLKLVAQGASEFNQALAGANRALAGFTSAIGKAGGGLGALGQVATGALREIGALATRGFVQAGRAALRFGEDILQAALKGSALERTLAQARNGLIEVTRISLAPFFDQLDGLIQRAAPKLLGLAQYAGQTLGSLGQQALTWGSNIVTSLANGIIAGAGAVIDALSYIGGVITSWLMPGSPPKLLPDLDDWGQGAAEAWLEGWTRASFDTFAELSGTLEGLIRSAPGGDKAGIVPRILGTREGIAKAVDELRTAGSVSAATLDAITASVGMADATVRGYLESLIKVQAADQDVKAAQAELNRVTKEYDDLLKPVEDKLSAVDEAQRQFVEEGRISQLRLIEQDPNATLAEKAMARFEIEKILGERQKRALVAEKKAAVETAQTKVNEAEKAKDAADDEFSARKSMLQVLTDQNRLMAEQARILEQLAGAGGAPKAPAGKAGGLGGIIRPDTSWIDGWLEKLEPLRAKFDALKATWDGLWKSFLEQTAPIRDAFGEMWQALKDNDPEAFFTALDKFFGGLWDFVRPLLEKLLTSLSAWVIEKAPVILETLAEWGKAFIAWIGPKIPPLLEEAGKLATSLFDWVVEQVPELVAKLLKWAAEFTAWLGPKIESMLTEAGKFLGRLTAWIITTGVPKLVRKLAEWGKAFVDWVTKEAVPKIGPALDSYLKAVGDYITNNLLPGFVAFGASFVTSLLEGLGVEVGNIGESLKAIGKSIIDGIAEGISINAGSLFGAAVAAATGAIDKAKTALGIQSPSRVAADEIGLPFGLGIAQGIVDSIGAIEMAGQRAAIAPVATAAQIGGSVNNSRTFAPVLNYQPQYSTAARAPQQEYALWQVMIGAPA